jgi:hypothetical protein
VPGSAIVSKNPKSKPTDHWNTPAWLAKTLGRFQGGISLDPCSNATSLVSARFVAHGGDGLDGLTLDWVDLGRNGLIYINPPYSDVGPWAEKFSQLPAESAAAMLVKLDPTTRWWKTAMYRSAGFFTFRERLRFGRPGLDKKQPGANFASALIVNQQWAAAELDALLCEDADWWEKGMESPCSY